MRLGDHGLAVAANFLVIVVGLPRGGGDECLVVAAKSLVVDGGLPRGGDEYLGDSLPIILAGPGTGWSLTTTAGTSTGCSLPTAAEASTAADNTLLSCCLGLLGTDVNGLWH